MKAPTQRERLIELFDSTQLLRASEIVDHGINRKTLQRSVESGEIRRIARGLYARTGLDPGSHHTLALAQRFISSGVICLLSALSYHEIGTQSPRRVWIAVSRRSRLPNVAGHPIRVVTFSGPAFSEGIEAHRIEGLTVRVYSAAKTVADCFKFRNKLGTDVAIEALREAVRSRKASADELLRFADICRVRNVMMPYLESALQ